MDCISIYIIDTPLRSSFIILRVVGVILRGWVEKNSACRNGFYHSLNSVFSTPKYFRSDSDSVCKAVSLFFFFVVVAHFRRNTYALVMFYSPVVEQARQRPCRSD